MKRLNRLFNRWWWLLAAGLAAEGLAIYEAYQERGEIAYGGEMLILPMTLLLIYAVESARKDRRR